MNKKIITFLLSLVMLTTVTVLPASGTFAKTNEETTHIYYPGTSYGKTVKTQNHFKYMIDNSDPSYVTVLNYVQDENKTENLVVPEKLDGKPVKVISKDFAAFDTDIKSVTIPKNVSEIGDGAFLKCKNLSKIKIEGNIKRLGTRFYGTAYYNKKSNRKNGVLYLGRYLLDGTKAKGNVKVKNGTLCIADNAFRYYDGSKQKRPGLKSVTIPKSVKYIGNHAFENSAVSSVSLGKNTEYIGNGAFCGCKNLKTIKAGNKIIYIGNGAFSNTKYSKNRKNKYDHALYLGKYLLKADKKKTSKIKKGTVLIASNAFANSKKASKIKFPTTVKYINANAFYKCENLSEINLPKGIKKIDNSAFERSSALKKITLSKKNKHYTVSGGALFNKKKSILIIYPARRNAKSFKIPDAVTRINKYAFYGASKLKSITIGKRVKYIEEYAFANCYSLSKATIPANVKFIGAGAFGTVISSDSDDTYYSSKKFTIYAKKGSAAEKYANTVFDNGEETMGPLNFVEIK